MRPSPGRRPVGAPRRYAALVVALAALVLAACGSGGEGGPAAPAGPTRTVATANGPVAVPATPQRVVALGESALDTAMGVGVTPVGTTASRGGTAPPAYLGPQAASLPIVGTVSEPNVEQVLAVQPDLVLAPSGLAAPQYDALSRIAPTVVPAAATTEWEAGLRTYADALGRTPQLDAALGEVAQRANAAAPRGTFAILRWMPTGPVVMNAALMPGSILQRAGGVPVGPATTLGARPHTDPLSLENLGQVDADRIFVASLNAQGRAALEAAQQQPAFTRLRAAQGGAVTPVDGGVWSSSSGPIAARMVVEDLERATRP